MLAIAPALIAIALILDTGNPDRRTAAAVFVAISIYTWTCQAIYAFIEWMIKEL